MLTKLLQYSYLARYVLLNGVGIQDYKDFPCRIIENKAPAFAFVQPPNNHAQRSILDRSAPAKLIGDRSETMDQYLERNGTVAFLVIQHDQLVCERYYQGYGHDSVCTSFSIAKAFVSAMVGIALHERLLGSLEDPLPHYLPELKGPAWERITLRHLISMSSGLHSTRGAFMPWSDHPRIYYSLDLRKVAMSARPVEPPGLHFEYNNYNLLLLGMILERVTGGPVSNYLSEKIWKPLGMEAPGSWSMDSQRSGMEKMESGINARAIDFAKFGRLYLRCGDWNGRQLVPQDWVAESTSPWPDGRWTNFKYFWWIPKSGKGRFMTVGNLAQYIYVAPDKDCIILRFGHGKPKDWKTRYVELLTDVADKL